MDESHWIGARRFEISDVAGGCLVAWGSVALSCLLLVINGAFVMAALAALAASGADWIQNEKASQFVLFAGPLALLVIQWMLIDTLRWILRRRRGH